MKRLLWISLALLSTAALAQQQLTPAQQTAANLGQQIGLLAASNMDLADEVRQLKAQLAQANAHMKVLEDKYEPKTPDSK